MLKRLICFYSFGQLILVFFCCGKNLEVSALRGNLDAQMRLGYSEINKSPPNWSQALFWFEMAADRENANAFFWLGHGFNNGLGTQKNSNRAISYWERGASLGSVDCSKALAMIFNKELDHITAYAWKLIYEQETKNTTQVLKLTKNKKLSVRDKEYAIKLAKEIKQSWNTKTESPVWDPMTKPPRFGRMKLNNNSFYNGIVFKDQPNGYGTLKSVGGETYYGYFKNGQKHGFGTVHDQDGRIVFQGNWNKGVPTIPSSKTY